MPACKRPPAFERKLCFSREQFSGYSTSSFGVHTMDLISRLPEPILHDILHRLSPEDSMRTCVLFKTWRQVQSSCPFMDFDQSMVVVQVEHIIFYWDRSFHQMMNFMKTSLDRFLSNPNSGNLLQLRLKLCFLSVL